LPSISPLPLDKEIKPPKNSPEPRFFLKNALGKDIMPGLEECSGRLWTYFSLVL
jgi:hypothetical protein